ncbi:hypothetical protein SAMN02799624_02082 [Paenibacillus sp. UNC496MF]|uniref:hypothetical protein n=1 Tax=Paenibacillus sp. UNC496MF TaxID=1502753 RepID=UPI0008EA956D|nr:hypothetical protein [Paenibacillus sp. UNC496MF]SFI76662.1 hypothetical protein SAMN02799624_02082 [Paenibacillus sp. UNC496MF]
MGEESQSELETSPARLRRPDVVRLLAEELSGSELNTLLLEVFRARTAASSAADLLRRYRDNRFVKPAAADPIALKRLELELLSIAVRQGAAPVQLSPVAPLGTASVIAEVDQNNVVSALRGTEVVSDATNLLALHACELIRAEGASRRRDERLRLCTTHRHVRAQFFGDAPGMLPHFHLFGQVTAGRDTGSYGFEKPAFWEHVAVYRAIFRERFDSDIEVVLSARGGYPDAEGLVARIAADGEANGAGIRVSIGEAKPDHRYYAGLQFAVKTTIAGRELTIGDGGFVDWTQRLLGSKKERLLISAIGLDRLMN